MLGNPDYTKAKYVSEEILSKMPDDMLKNSYTVMSASVTHNPSTKYPIIPMLSKSEKSN